MYVRKTKLCRKKTSRILSILLFLISIYLFGILYYQNHFLPHTQAIGVTIANETVEAANLKLLQKLDNLLINIEEKQQTIDQIALKEIVSEMTVMSSLMNQLSKQNIWLWFLSFFKKSEVIILDEKNIQIDDGRLLNHLRNIGIDNRKRIPSQDASIVQTSKGFAIQEAQQGSQLSLTFLKQAIIETINYHKTSVLLDKTYILPSITSSNHQLLDKYRKIEKMLQTEIVLILEGIEIIISKNQILNWIYIDRDKEPHINQESIIEFLQQLDIQYASIYHTRIFNSTYQGEVFVVPRTYGWSIDILTESNAIVDAIKKGETIKRSVAIVGNKQEIGDSYVEVDIMNQMMLIYINGKLVIETPIVTGSPKTETIPGAYQVIEKKQNTVLTGYNKHLERAYQQPVDYWIAFDTQGQGIHDAKWQSVFGGQTYLFSGSLGCINVPPSKMSKIYEAIYLGMPVIIY